MKIRTEKVIDVDEWDELVKGTYGRPYSFQQQEGCKDRGSYTFTVPDNKVEDFEATEVPEKINGEEMGVSFEAWLKRDPKQPVGKETSSWSIELFWDRNFYPVIGMVANDLHEKGLLEAGKYRIIIDW